VLLERRDRGPGEVEHEPLLTAITVRRLMLVITKPWP